MLNPSIIQRLAFAQSYIESLGYSCFQASDIIQHESGSDGAQYIIPQPINCLKRVLFTTLPDFARRYNASQAPLFLLAAISLSDQMPAHTVLVHTVEYVNDVDRDNRHIYPIAIVTYAVRSLDDSRAGASINKWPYDGERKPLYSVLYNSSPNVLSGSIPTCYFTV